MIPRYNYFIQIAMPISEHAEGHLDLPLIIKLICLMAV